MALAALLVLLVQASVSIAGTVHDTTGLPLSGVTVAIEDDGAVVARTRTDTDGRFSFPPTPPHGLLLVVSLDGFTTVRRPVGPAFVAVTIVLEPAGVTDQVVVRAPRPEDTTTRHELRALDVARTPGTQADLFRMVQTLPGVVQVDDGAGMYVRGGDVNETAVLVDGITLSHPYRYESPTGGWAGSVDAFQLEGISFDAGAFPARFGNALSGVLDLHTLGLPQRRQLTATAGLAGASLSLAQPLGDRAGVRISGNRTWTRLLFAVNGSPRAFEQEPEGWDLRVSVHANAGRAGRFKAAFYGQGDAVGVELLQDGFRGFLHSDGTQLFGSVTWELTPRPDVSVRAAVGHDRYARGTDVGVLALDTTDRTTTARIDVERAAGATTWRVGVDTTPTSVATAGHTSIRGGDFAGATGVVNFAIDARTSRTGVYGEAQHRAGRVTLNAGARVDRFPHEHATAIEPRASAVLTLSDSQRLRAGWGIYRHGPRPEYYDQYRGATRLDPLKSVQYVAGYELGGRDVSGQLRVEAYLKDYDHLPLEADEGGYTSDGYGSASGIDVFARKAWSRADLRSSYGYLRARRRWTPSDQFHRYALPNGTWRPDFEIPHTLSIVGTASVTEGVSFAASWRRASGKPFTPVMGTERADGQFVPLFGPINSDRLPYYERVDVSASLARPFGNGLAIFFAGVSNLAGRENGFAYAYSADYLSRELVVTSSPRSIYVGVSIIH